MKLQTVKFKDTVYFENTETLFLDTERHRVELDYDPKTLLIKMSSAKDVCYSSAANVCWFKPAKE